MIQLTFLAITSGLLAPPLTAGRVYDVPKVGGFDYMAVDPKFHRVFASHPRAGTLAVLDQRTGKIMDLDMGGAVNGVQIDEALGKVLVAGGGQKFISLDRATLKQTGHADLSGPGDDLAIDTRRQQAYVDHDDGTEVWVFDIKSMKLIGSVAVAGAPEYVEYDARTDRLYQNIKPTNQIQVINPKTRKVEASWATGAETGPHGLAIDRATGKIFSAGSNGKMDVFTRGGKLLGTVDIAPGTDQIAFDSILKRVYCASRGFISVVQETSSGAKSLGNVPAPAGSHTIAVDPMNHDVWICYSDRQAAHFQVFHVK